MKYYDKELGYEYEGEWDYKYELAVENAELIAVTKPVSKKLLEADMGDLTELIAYCARVSNPANQMNTESNEKLLKYLSDHKHFSPFEMANAVIEINTTRDIGRQILRHRSFCLGADSVIWFDLPDVKCENKYKAYKKSISYLYDRFHNGAEPLPNGVRMPMKNRIKSMKIRCMNEDTGEIIHTHINDITKSRAILYKVTFDNGNIVTSSLDHKYYTENGWMKLSEAISKDVKFVAQGLKSINNVIHEFPYIDEEQEIWKPISGWDNYHVSNMGRVKRIGKHSQNKIRSGTPSKSTGYPVISLNKPGIQVEMNAQRLVLETFCPMDDYINLVARHKNHNKLDCRLSNLEWGSMSENLKDSNDADMHGRLRTNLTSIVDYECIGEQDSYDISVIGPYHNFICDGQVVHNSFQEFSQRYADVQSMGDAFVLREARLQHPKNRQDSLETEDELLKRGWFVHQQSVIDHAFNVYKWALENGIAKEQARSVLPEGNTKTKMYMQGTLRSWMHYVELRSGNGTQKEHMRVAIEVAKALREFFPTIDNYVN